MATKCLTIKTSFKQRGHYYKSAAGAKNNRPKNLLVLAEAQGATAHTLSFPMAAVFRALISSDNMRIRAYSRPPKRDPHPLHRRQVQRLARRFDPAEARANLNPTSRVLQLTRGKVENMPPFNQKREDILRRQDEGTRRQALADDGTT